MIEHCIYCGDWYQCRDHVIPINYQQTYRDYKPGSTVKCCTECNSFLGDRPYHTIESRAKYLITAYIQNRKDDLNFTDWAYNEIRDFGYNLRTSLEVRIARKQVYLRKLENLELVSNGFECKPFRYNLEQDSNATFASAKKCFNCGTRYFNVKNNEFCSFYCNQQHKAKLVAEKFPEISEEEALNRVQERRCVICDDALHTTKLTALFCSKKCQKLL